MSAIVTAGLSKRYGDAVAVDDLSFRVSPGTVTGFLGPNGAGKSTTLKLMLGLVRGAGTTTFDGVRYEDLREPRRRVGVMLESRAFHPGRTATAHLAMMSAGTGVGPPRIAEVLDEVGLSAVGRRRVGAFSLGMTQRLGLAAAILARPDTLILDEPANGLDPDGIRWLRSLLRDYAARGNTVLVSSHVLSEIELVAEHVVVIAQGRLVADMATAEFIAMAGLTSVEVRVSHTAEFVAALRARGLQPVVDPSGQVTVCGIAQQDVAGIAARHGGVTYGLLTRTGSLEESFLKIAKEGAR